MDILEKDILDSISIIREKRKRPDAKSILSTYHLLVLQILPWEESIKQLVAKSTVVNRKTKQDFRFSLYC